MRIYVINPYYDRPGYEEPMDQFQLEVSNEARKYGPISTIRDANIAPGADLPAVLIEYGWQILPIAIFFGGKLVRENIEAWIDIAKKLKTACAGISKRFGGCVVVTEESAAVLPITVLAEKCPHMTSISFKCQITIDPYTEHVELIDPSSCMHSDSQFRRKETSASRNVAFINIYQVNGAEWHTVTVRQSGAVICAEKMWP